jgi:hypothetical protein
MTPNALQRLKCRRKRRKKLLAALNVAISVLSLHIQLQMKRYRSPNIFRDLNRVIRFIDGKSESWFYKSYRLSRNVFHYILKLIKPELETSSPYMTKESYHGTFNAKVLLAATLRFLAGGNYIDLVDLYLLPGKPHGYFWRTLRVLDKVLEDITLPSTNKDWYELSRGWKEKMNQKFSVCYMKCTTLAVDGIVLETTEPNTKEVNGNIVGNFNRKGYFAMVGLAAVDCEARFRFAELDWAGSTHDAIAFRGSLLDEKLPNRIPRGLYYIGDEAFSACGLITPFSRRSLRGQSREDPLYQKKRAFNYLLAFQRSTVERAFGLLLRKFVILTTRLSYRRRNIKLMFRVCCKLHNMCVDERLLPGSRTLRYISNSGNEETLSDEVIIREFLNGDDNYHATRVPRNIATIG